MPVTIIPLVRPVLVSFDDSSTHLPSAVQEKINTYWNQLIAQGRQYTRGEVFTIVSQEENQQEIRFVVQKTDYAHYLYSKNVGGLGEYSIRVIHAAAYVVCSTGEIIVGRMGEHTGRAGMIQLCGGGLDYGDLKEGTLDLEHSLVKELGEEIGVDCSDSARVHSLVPTFLKTEGSSGTTVVMYRVDIADSAPRFAERYKFFGENLKAQGITPEFSEIFAIKPDHASIETFIAKYGQLCDENLAPLLRLLAK